MTDSWAGIGVALELANREWDVSLMPLMIADMRDVIASRYAENPAQSFRALMESVIENQFGFDRGSDEWRAAKQVLGTLFNARKQQRHKYNFTK